MKRLYILVVFFFISSAVSAQSQIFWQKVEWGMRHIAAAQSIDQLNKAATIFKDLSKGNNGSYLPDYYVALVFLFEADYFEQITARDSLVDSAMDYIKKAEALSPNNVELEFLRGYALTTKLMSDPAYRGEEYAPQIITHYKKAMTMEPKNPRAPTFLAMNMINMPQFFISDEFTPCALALSAKEMFLSYHKDHLLVWGKEVADKIVQECN